MARAVRNGFQVSFNTNGWLVNATRAQAICDAGVSIAYVSLDGMERATMDHSRGRKGSFDKAMEAIDLFDALPNPRVVIAAILHAENAAEMAGLLEFVRDREMQLVVQPLYQNFGENTYDPDWYKDSPLWPRTPGALTELDAAVDLLSAERMRGGAVCAMRLDNCRHSRITSEGRKGQWAPMSRRSHRHLHRCERKCSYVLLPRTRCNSI